MEAVVARHHAKVKIKVKPFNGGFHRIMNSLCGALVFFKHLKAAEGEQQTPSRLCSSKYTPAPTPLKTSSYSTRETKKKKKKRCEMSQG